MQSDHKDKRAKKKKTPCETVPSKLIKICCVKKGVKREHLPHSVEKK